MRYTIRPIRKKRELSTAEQFALQWFDYALRDDYWRALLKDRLKALESKLKVIRF